MIRIPLSDPVEYLVSRKFPYSLLTPKMEGPGRGRFKHEQELITEIEAYRSELRAMPPKEFQTLCEQEQEKERQERQGKLNVTNKSGGRTQMPTNLHDRGRTCRPPSDHRPSPFGAECILVTPK
jgi:hypothetical protein